MKIVWSIVVLAVVVVGGYFLLSKGEGDQMASVAEIGSLKNIVGSGEPLVCEVSHTVEGVLSNGTVYAANGKMRADFTSEQAGAVAIETHMINAGEYAYTWTSSAPIGFKTKIKVATTIDNGVSASADEATTSPEAISLDSEVSYTCKPWTLDENIFALPSDITFQELGATVGGAAQIPDVSEIMKNIPNMPAGIPVSEE